MYCRKRKDCTKGTHRELMDSEGVYSRLYRMSSEEEAEHVKNPENL